MTDSLPTDSAPDNAFSLDRPMPQDALSAHSSRWGGYGAYPAFSWSWWLRRGWVLWPVAIAYGCAFATWHAAGMNMWSDWPGLALRACGGILLMVSAGPMLATLVRHWRLPYDLERVLVIASIVAGLGMALFLEVWVDNYHSMLMEHYRGRTMNIPYVFRALSNLLRISLDGSTLLLIFAGGGFAVFQYLSEKRRLADYARRRELETVREEKDAADMRLAVLQAQVEPHFLFNTLASVRSLVPVDPDRAVATINALADYLRSTLPSFREIGRDTSVDGATLGKQIEICQRYLELMNVRMDGRIRIVIDASDEVRSRAFPPLILLSLVENAVKHGIEPKPGPGMIAIRASVRSDGGLEIAVEDDGAGLQLGATHGVGLANIRAQLRNRFGDGAVLDIASRPQGGTRAAISMDKA
jgi:two-component sensor histidine kinase